ncbi:NAD(P)-binding Rossmann-fold superfamily protein [Klebsormidium nitens]|uniref:NAD(P)-binding Rossmann-fold superfamily protein n=1 Tax=Klebsormidium nitens TaxID=105231 RepID=A0A1Y1IB36_KLENI|nr:NAD(P)-binding Rossmann-fold superfamily protein [Klebsormidium nitens]|eukprot:GAQ88130.1 NAD(P)-binding Rossmann-fold superfamily protein [Klebsormidium nitens]
MSPVNVLVIGATGYIGRHIALAAAAAPEVGAYALISKATAGKPERKEVLEQLRSAGVQFLEGDLYDHASLVAALKQVSIVISTVSFAQLADQTKIIDAAKEAGTITRFLPSEFGLNPSEKTIEAFGELATLWAIKKNLLPVLVESGIPYTLVWSNGFAGYSLPGLGALGPPVTDEVTVFGSGDVKSVNVDEGDIGTYTIKAALDPRAANKTVHLEPPQNFLTQNELIALAEKARGKTYKRKTVSAEELLQQYKTFDPSIKFLPYLHYSIWIAGDMLQPLPEGHVSSVDLYPDVEYKTLAQLL